MRRQCHLMHVILLPLKFQLMAKQSLVNILRIQVASMMVWVSSWLLLTSQPACLQIFALWITHAHQGGEKPHQIMYTPCKLNLRYCEIALSCHLVVSIFEVISSHRFKIAQSGIFKYPAPIYFRVCQPIFTLNHFVALSNKLEIWLTDWTHRSKIPISVENSCFNMHDSEFHWSNSFSRIWATLN
jgi:hypothetical protein